MKLMFITDTHFSSQAPLRRKDKWPDVCLEKLQATVDSAKKHKIDYILSGGDWFKALVPEPPYWLAREVKMILNSGPPVISILGQHDVYGHNPDTFSRGVLGLLESSNFRILEDIMFLEDGTVLKGFSHRDSLLSEIVHPDAFKDCDIALVHAMVVPYPVAWDHVVYDQIVPHQAIICCGDYHPGFLKSPILNPGSFMRLSIESIPRVPYLLRLDTVSESVCTFWIQTVPTAKHSEDVFDMDRYEKDKDSLDKAEVLSNFINQMKGVVSLNTEYNLSALIDSLATRFVVPQDIVRMAKEMCKL